ncbi:MAG: SDR family NAD(P)-dependent oxidoreductase [Deltaproteobacteria bacterium]|nr:SDR family NAD(P)-dependent oxidoreductase [Deltaproteobacteria bacterium]
MPRAAIVVGVGPSAGLGAALCRRFAREGMHVFAAARSEERTEELAREIAATGGRASAQRCDTTQSADVAVLFDAAQRETGAPPACVVYNAGNNRMSPLLEMTDEFFEQTWRTSCYGGFLVGREAARRMLPAGGGTLIFTGATASLRARPPFTAFASAKAALRSVAFGMAREFGARGLHVGHVIVDGVIDGDQVNARFPQLKERLGADGMLAPDDIAEAYWQLHRQPRSAWTLELDLRPYKESF